MDLLSTVRKQGSRGGVDFKWDDVKGSSHRENYLGNESQPINQAGPC